MNMFSFNRLSAFLLLFFTLTSLSKAQISVSLPIIDAGTLTNGTIVNVPLTVVTGSANVGSIQLTIIYDPLVLTPVVQSATNVGLVNPYAPTTASGGSWFAGAGAGNAISANWSDPTFTGINIPSGTVLFSLQFTYLGGESALTFSTTPNVNVFYNSAFAVIPLTMTNGGIFNPVTGPSATTLAAADITQTAATLNGEIAPDNNSLNAFFQYGLTVAYGNTASAGTVAGTATVMVNSPVSGLTPNTEYHFRLIAVNGTDTIFGSDLNFTTLSTTAFPPTAITVAANGISSSSANLQGSVNANGANTSVIFHFGTTTSFGDSIVSVPATITGQSSQNVSALLSNLLPETTYFYRVKAVNTEGTSLGSTLSFTTLPANQLIIQIGSISTPLTPETEINIPVTVIAGGTGIGSMQFSISFDPAVLTPVQQSATNGGIVNPCAQTTANGGEWVAGTGSGSSISPNWYDPTFTGIELPDGTLLFDIRFTYHGGSTNLIVDTTSSLVYNANFEEYAVQFINGTIGDPAPVAITLDPEVDGLSALLRGKVNANQATTTASFEYGTSIAYGSEIDALENPITGNSDVNVSANLTGLQAGVTYYYRVKATNASGTSFGQNKTFLILSSTDLFTQPIHIFAYDQTIVVQPGTVTEPGQVSLYDLAGRRLAQTMWNGSEELSFSSPASGMLLVAVENPSGIVVKKVLIPSIK
jgi:hypothetical protein